MFVVQSKPSAPYRDPWDLPFQERWRSLLQKQTRVAYFYERADNSTFRYRVYNMAQVLNGLSTTHSAGFFFLSDERHFQKIAEEADALVICRVRFCDDTQKIVTAFRNRGKPVFFDVDDLVFDIDKARFIANTIGRSMQASHDLDAWYAYIGRIGVTLRQCDACITTNDYLADRIRDFASKPVKVIPNFLNREQADLSASILQAKRASNFLSDGKIHLGYFSGSPSHARDFQILIPGLTRLMHRRGNVHLMIAGYIEAESLEEIFPGRVHYHAFRDYVSLQSLVACANINVVPLQTNLFTHCKSELKYFEAAAVGTISVASPTFTYQSAIHHGDNGYLSRAHEWDSMLELAIENFPNYASMADKAATHALEHYSWENQLPSIVNALTW